MDFRLLQQQAQKLILSPQIQQYLKLLQLPLVELQHTVEQELVENPVLEDTQTQTDDSSQELTHDEPDTQSQQQEELDFQKKIDMLDKLDEQFRETYHNNYDTRQESIDDLEKKHNYRETLVTEDPTIFDYFSWQLSFLELSDTDKRIAEEMVGNIHSDGYFRMDLQELAELFREPLAKITDVLFLLQSLDPPGVFGRTLQEVLMLQLERKEATPVNRLAYRILDEHFELFKRSQFDQIARATNKNIELVEHAVRIISMLEPKPGRIFSQSENITVVPDATIYRSPDEEYGYAIEIHDESIPTLRISKYYRDMLKKDSLDATTKDYIKQKINAGMWFIKAIEQRKSTLRLITEEIIRVQNEFFEKGFSHLKPLTLRDIAQQVSIHESTVSRALSGKFVSTPQGTIPFKSFFSNKMPTTDGEFESQKSVMEKIKKIVDTEDPRKPFSDSRIVKLMDIEGVKIARRTVAKYREILRILPSHLRKQR